MRNNKYKFINTNIHKIKLHLRRGARRFDLARKVKEIFIEDGAIELRDLRAK